MCVCVRVCWVSLGGQREREREGANIHTISPKCEVGAELSEDAGVIGPFWAHSRYFLPMPAWRHSESIMLSGDAA